MSRHTYPLAEREALYLEARRQWGNKAQFIAAAEEFAEAAAVMSRHANGKVENLSQLFSELADAEIMLEQMRLEFGEDGIEVEKTRKLERLASRLGVRLEAK